MLTFGGLLVASSLYVTVGAQATRSVNDGIYSDAQAKRGEAVYKDNCAACHGDNLEGSGPMPPLAGKDFLMNWNGKAVAELFDKVQSTMPATAPGTLTPQQTADVLAYTLNVGKYPAGATELESKVESLSQIKIEPAKP